MDIYELSQVAYIIGVPLYQDIVGIPFLRSVVTVGGVDFLPLGKIPEGTDTFGIHLIEQQYDGRHAMCLLIDNREMKFSLFDPSRVAVMPIHNMIRNYMEENGYSEIRYRGGFLPQRDDKLCVLWSVWMVKRVIDGLDPYPQDDDEKNRSFESFVSLVEEIVNNKYIDEYNKFLRFTVDLALNNQKIDQNIVVDIYRCLTDKNLLYQLHKADHKISTSVDRPLDESNRFKGVIEFLYATDLDNVESVVKSIKDARLCK